MDLSVPEGNLPYLTAVVDDKSRSQISVFKVEEPLVFFFSLLAPDGGCVQVRYIMTY